MNKVYYYSFRRFNLWLIFNILLVAKVIYCIKKCPIVFAYPQSYVILGCIFVSIAVWCYKYLMKHPLAYVNDKGIKITIVIRLIGAILKARKKRLCIADSVKCRF